jgi:hypothetical protein
MARKGEIIMNYNRLSLILVTMAVSAIAMSAVPRVRNWDFEYGNVAFTNDLTHNPFWMYGEGSYVVDTDPHVYHQDWARIADHTKGDGTGKMLIVNGHVRADKPMVWMQTLDQLRQNENYDFSVFAASLMGARKSELVLTIDGEEIGNTFQGADFGQWRQSKATFNTGSRTSVVLGIKNKNTESNGNDIALDDINVQVSPVPEPAGLAALALGGAFLMRKMRKS